MLCGRLLQPFSISKRNHRHPRMAFQRRKTAMLKVTFLVLATLLGIAMIFSTSPLSKEFGAFLLALVVISTVASLWSSRKAEAKASRRQSWEELMEKNRGGPPNYYN
jgi:hypothetical protein